MQGRKIIHVDMDAFFASVEQRDDPSLRGKPVIVGGDPGGRGVVAACSYEARKYGVHSAMPAGRAARLCPGAVFLRPRFEAYRETSRTIASVFTDYTDLVEPASLDEAYLDVTVNKKNNPSATSLAREIRARILDITGLTCSAGVSYNKFLAKVASDHNKPNGLTVIRPEEARAFIAALPIGKFHGIGKVTERKMKQMGVHMGADLARRSIEELTEKFGKAGAYYHAIARGFDERPVEPFRERKSLGKEVTLSEDTDDERMMESVISGLASLVSESAAKKGIAARTLTVKVRYSDFESITRSFTRAEGIGDAADMLYLAKALLEKTEAGKRKVRLLGLSLSNFESEEGGQRRPVQLKLPFY